MARRRKKERAAGDRVIITGPTWADSSESGIRGMRRASRNTLVLGIVFVVVLLLMFLAPLAIFEGSVYKVSSITQIYEMMLNNLDGLVGVFTGNPYKFETRFMEVVCGAVSGAALGLCGSTYQGAFNNPLAAPKTLGVMAGGALGALIWVVFGPNIGLEEPLLPSAGPITASQFADFESYLSQNDPVGWIINNYGQALCSVVGCFVVVGLVLLVVSIAGHGRLGNVIVIVVGSVVAAAVTGLINFARYYFTTSGGDAMIEELRAIENYVTLDEFAYTDLLVVVLPIMICIIIVLLLRNRLTLLSFGDEEAHSMGVNVNRTRYIMIAICTFMTAWSISFCGHVAFLGFISAHISRKVVGPDFRYLLPASCFTGGLLMILIDWLSQSGLPYTYPEASGAMCSIIGACIFIVLAFREGRRALSRGGE